MYTLATPTVPLLGSYRDALLRGWSPDNLSPEQARRQELERIEADPAGFVASLDDLDARGGDLRMPDGSTVPRLPGFRRWVLETEADGPAPAFLGSIGFRFARGTSALPPYCLGHIGYGVVPWHRGRGVASFALQTLLRELRSTDLLAGMGYLELTTQPDNIASQRVIEKCGGRFVESFATPAPYGDHTELRYRIPLD